MSDLQEQLQQAADEAGRLGRLPGPEAAIRRGRQRRRRLVGGTASLVVLMLVAGALGTGRLASRQTPLTPTPTVPPTTNPVTRMQVTDRDGKLDVQVHLGPLGFLDREGGMASQLANEMEGCQGGPAQVRMWAQVLGETWVLAAKEPVPGKDWVCWSDGLFGSTGSRFGGHGGSKDRLKLLQASRLSMPIEGKGELEVIGGAVTRQAVRLRILFQIGPPIDLVPLDAGPQFPVKFYAVFYLQSAMTTCMPERVVAYDKAGHRIAERWATTTGQGGNVCDRPQGGRQPP
jgi:hypothetical protein